MVIFEIICFEYQSYGNFDKVSFLDLNIYIKLCIVFICVYVYGDKFYYGCFIFLL